MMRVEAVLTWPNQTRTFHEFHPSETTKGFIYPDSEASERTYLGNNFSYSMFDNQTRGRRLRYFRRSRLRKTSIAVAYGRSI